MDDLDDQPSIRGFLYSLQMARNAFLRICISVFAIGLSYDLVKTIRNPIGNFGKHIKVMFTLLFATIITFMLIQLFVMEVLPRMTGTNIGHQETIMLFIEPFYVLILVVELYWEILAVYVSYKGLFKRKGLNQKERDNIFRR